MDPPLPARDQAPVHGMDILGFTGTEEGKSSIFAGKIMVTIFWDGDGVIFLILSELFEWRDSRGQSPR